MLNISDNTNDRVLLMDILSELEKLLNNDVFPPSHRLANIESVLNSITLDLGHYLFPYDQYHPEDNKE